MSIGFIMGQLARDKVDPVNDVVLFEANVRQLQKLISAKPAASEEMANAMNAVISAARVILRHRYEGQSLEEDLENFHRSVDRLKLAVDR